MYEKNNGKHQTLVPIAALLSVSGREDVVAIKGRVTQLTL